MNKTKLINLLGLAQRAGRLQSGDFIVEKALKKGTVELLLMATDCAANNEKKYKQLTDVYKVPLYKVLTKEQLGSAIGKEIRVVIAVTDAGFAKAILKEIGEPMN